MELSDINAENISVVKDPFNKKSLERIMIVVTKGLHPIEHTYAYATVDFKNGNTNGTQKFGNHADFKVLMVELQAFIDTLK